MRTLKPIYDFDRYSAPIAKEIYGVLYRNIFQPLFQILEEPRSVRNATTTHLVEALRSGRIQYVGGFFIGPLNVAISKELRGIGAVYNKVKKAYKLETSHLPQDVLLAVTEGNVIAKTKLKKVEDFLRAVEGRKIKGPEVEKYLGDTLVGLGEQFKKSTKDISSRDLEIPLDTNFSQKLKDAYTTNLEMYINEWHQQAILRLRLKVSRNVEKGFRAESLISTIQAEKKVSYNKAKFLAKQETSLMVSKYREIRYEEIGVKKYMWSTSKDVRVRHDHRELQGQIFRFDQPPVTDRHTMARNNPGEDFGCRCVAIPVLSTYNMPEIRHANR